MEEIYENAKIVIVDDIEEVLISTKNCLEFEGMQVKCFSNPMEAIEYLKTNKDDVLLLDFYMPQMNGDEFVEELRKYNQETIIILQTGYSDKIPPLEMIDKMNIQGYLDKLKGEDELVLMTKSAVKTSFLNKQIRKKDKEIAMLNYKKALIGDLVSHLVNESKDQLFQIAGMNESIKRDTDEYSEENRVIKNATDKIYELYEALNFENQKVMNAEQLEKTIKELLKAKLLLNNANISFINNAQTTIISNANKVIYLVLKVVDSMIKSDSKQIEISINEEGQTINLIINDIENKDNDIDLEELEILKGIENINIKLENNIVVVSILK